MAQRVHRLALSVYAVPRRARNPLRIHAILYDHSRYIAAIVATRRSVKSKCFALWLMGREPGSRALCDGLAGCSIPHGTRGPGPSCAAHRRGASAHQDVLDHLHILANYEWDSRAPLSIILVGLPEAKQRLGLAKKRSLWSRIHTRISLGARCTRRCHLASLRNAGCAHPRTLAGTPARHRSHRHRSSVRAGRSRRLIVSSWFASLVTNRSTISGTCKNMGLVAAR